MSNNILYLSCHETLEHAEVKLFHELGYKVFSPGAYVSNENKGDNDLRPSIPGLKYDPDILEQWHKLAGQHYGKDAKYHLSKEFVDNFDTVIVMHLPEFVYNNWEAMKHKRVIWRTIGQSLAPIEKKMQEYKKQGMQIVRYSPKEGLIPEYAGCDALIRFYKDPDVYQGYTGEKERVITFAQDMINRDRACNYTFFEQTTRPFNRALFGSGSEVVAFGQGKVPFSRLLEEMRQNRCYFYTGTHPASYTLNFMESWMTGIPIVAVGPKHGNANYFPGHSGLYEIPDLIEHGVSGFVSDNPNELQAYISLLFEEKDLAMEISKNARQEAIRHFGKAMIGRVWKEFLG